MTYSRQIVLKNGNTALLRNAEPSDACAVLENFSLTHAETDYLLTYPDESTFDAEREARFLQRKAESANEIEIIAVADGRVVATAGVDAVGTRDKLRHRAEFGVSVLRAYWGLGLGRALTEACIQCAKEAGYEQLELTVVAENERAIALYRKAGFVEFGRNPRGFRSRTSGYQEIVHMLLAL